MSMPSVSEIATQAGVSKSTVSLVLNAKNGVSDRMRARVLKAIQELQAVAATQPANPAAAIADIARSKNTDRLTILALHPSILSSTQHFAEVLQGIQQGTQRYNTQLNLASNDPDLPDESITSLYFSHPDLRPDGVLVFGTEHSESIGSKTREMGIPCVFVGVPLPGTDLSFVGPDEDAAAYNATLYLLEMGHCDIAFVSGDALIPATTQRITGYQKALAEAGLPTDNRLYIEPEPAGAELAFQRFISDRSTVTAVLLGNNHASRVGLPLLQQAGIDIPHDLSVIVFDDTDFQQTYDPPITTITYPLVREGYWAVRLLMDMIREPMLRGSQVFFDTVLSERQSCTPPRQQQ